MARFAYVVARLRLRKGTTTTVVPLRGALLIVAQATLPGITDGTANKVMMQCR
jgi:hypothetical protein